MRDQLHILLLNIVSRQISTKQLGEILSGAFLVFMQWDFLTTPSTLKHSHLVFFKDDSDFLAFKDTIWLYSKFV